MLSKKGEVSVRGLNQHILLKQLAAGGHHQLASTLTLVNGSWKWPNAQSIPKDQIAT